MLLTSIYKKYIQKSRIFLYPALKIRRGVSVTPVQTYMSWDGMYKFEENKFIVVYHIRQDKEFKRFEEQALLNNDLFHDFYELDNDKGAYVFDFSDHLDDYKLIRQGKYSQLSKPYKQRVLKFFKNHQRHHAHVESYLYPEKYFEMYAKMLRVNSDLLKEVGELCSKPKLDAEILISEKKILNLQTFNLNLTNEK
jgi:hypothetical protein